VAAVAAVIRQAYDAGAAMGMSVAGKLWQAPQPDRKFIALRAEQINLLSRVQARQLYRLLIPAG
jgi:DhnA family fructose-bisphosphate aldolase class Ia